MTEMIEMLCALLAPAQAGPRANISGLANGQAIEDIVSLAAIHNARPHLLRSLRLRPELHAAVETIAGNSFFPGHAVHCLNHVAALNTLCRSFIDANVGFAVLKGPVLAFQLYGNIAEREFGDLDIIVPPADRVRASQCLETLGYVPEKQNRREQHAFADHLNQESFFCQATGVSVDLHWQFAPAGVPFPIDAGDVWERLDRITLAGMSVPVLCREDCALYLAGHGMKDAWMSLDWCADFCAMLSGDPALDVAQIYRRACGNQCGLAVAVGVELSHRLFAFPANADVEIGEQHRRSAKLLADRYIAALKKKTSAQSSLGLWDGMELCETLPQKMRYLAAILFNRTIGDYEAMPLPQRLWQLYRITRPFRLLGSALTSRSARAGVASKTAA